MASKGSAASVGRLAQRRVVAAANQLKQLRDEFDFADAAGSQLDIVEDLAAFDLPAHLPMQTAHRLKRAVVEMAAEHERAHEFGKFLRAVAAHHARLDPGIAFPLAPLRDEVVLEHAEADRERAVAAQRPQPHIDAEHVAVGGNFTEQSDQPAREADEKFVIGENARAARRAVLGIDEHQIDIGGYVEFGPAKFAHGDDVQALRARAVVRRGFTVVQRKFAFEMGDRGDDGDIGERGYRRHDLSQCRQAAQIARDYAQHDAFAQVAQCAHQRRVAGGIGLRQPRAHFVRCRTACGYSRPAGVPAARRAGCAQSATARLRARSTGHRRRPRAR